MTTLRRFSIVASFLLTLFLVSSQVFSADFEWRVIDKDYSHKTPEMVGTREELWQDGKKVNAITIRLEKAPNAKHRWKSMVFVAKRSDSKYVKDGSFEAETIQGEKLRCFFKEGQLNGLFEFKYKNGSVNIQVSKYEDGQFEGAAQGSYEDGTKRFAWTVIDGRTLVDYVYRKDGAAITKTGKPEMEIKSLQKELGIID